MKKLLLYLINSVAYLILTLYRFKIEVPAQLNKNKLNIFFFNHMAVKDIFCIYSVLYKKLKIGSNFIMGSIRVHKIKRLLLPLYKYLGAIVLERIKDLKFVKSVNLKKKKVKNEYNILLTKLKSNNYVIISPEGTRNTVKLGEFNFTRSFDIINKFKIYHNVDVNLYVCVIDHRQKKILVEKNNVTPFTYNAIKSTIYKRMETITSRLKTYYYNSIYQADRFSTILFDLNYCLCFKNSYDRLLNAKNEDLYRVYNKHIKLYVYSEIYNLLKYYKSLNKTIFVCTHLDIKLLTPLIEALNIKAINYNKINQFKQKSDLLYFCNRINTLNKMKSFQFVVCINPLKKQIVKLDNRYLYTKSIGIK